VAGEGHGRRDRGEFVADHHRVGGLQRQVGAGLAHGDAGMGGGQRGGVVDAVADRQHLAPGGLRLPHGGDLVLGEQAGAYVADAELVGQAGGDPRVLAGEQCRRGAGQRRDSGLRGGTEPVGDAEHTHRLAVTHYQHRGLTLALQSRGRSGGGVGPRPGPIGQKPGRAADGDLRALDHGGHPEAGSGGEVVRGGDGQIAGAGGLHDGAGQRVLTGMLGRRRQGQQRFRVQTRTVQRVGVGDIRRALGEGAGLVQDDCVDLAEALNSLSFVHVCGGDRGLSVTSIGLTALRVESAWGRSCPERPENQVADVGDFVGRT
jgi:hypothetical protein